jgi:predicted transcriptional regulator
MASQFHGVSDVAIMLGVTPSAVSNWCTTAPAGFIAPDVEICSKGGVSARGWSEESMSKMRSWVERRMRLDAEAAKERWSRVDAGVAVAKRVTRDRVSGDQLLFDLEA